MQGVIRGKPGKEEYFLDGRKVTKSEFDAAFPDQPIMPGEVFGGQGLGCWPLVSDGAAVHPKQISEAKELAKRKGVPTEFTPAGQPIFSGRNHRKRYLAAHGMHDRSGGYGD